VMHVIRDTEGDACDTIISYGFIRVTSPDRSMKISVGEG
jgi:hypothetical protein